MEKHCQPKPEKLTSKFGSVSLHAEFIFGQSSFHAAQVRQVFKLAKVHQTESNVV